MNANKLTISVAKSSALVVTPEAKTASQKTKNICDDCLITVNSTSSGNAFVSGAGGLRFESWLVKSDTVLQTTCHRCDISLKEAVLPRRNDAEMGPANSLHAYSEYNERFDLKFLGLWIDDNDNLKFVICLKFVERKIACAVGMLNKFKRYFPSKFY